MSKNKVAMPLIHIIILYTVRCQKFDDCMLAHAKILKDLQGKL